MNSIDLATLTAGITTLGLEVSRGTATEKGRTSWKTIESTLDLNGLPHVRLLATDIASRLHRDKTVARALTALLQEEHVGAASDLVGSIRLLAGDPATKPDEDPPEEKPKPIYRGRPKSDFDLLNGDPHTSPDEEPDTDGHGDQPLRSDRDTP